MTAREEIKKAAMLGTRQQGFAAPVTGTALDGLLAGAGEVLDAAALVVAYEQAGPVPGEAGALPEPVEADTRPLCRVKHLGIILRDRRELLGEWLGLVAGMGKRPGEEWIPSLLEMGNLEVKLRPGVKAVAGPLGVWMAQHGSRWEWLRPLAPDEELWETGTLEERAGALQRIREKDRARARQMLDAVWNGENAEARQRLLAAYTDPPVSEDEEWLEGKRGDRSPAVRRVVVDRLAVLPGSRLVARMKARLRGRVSLEEIVPFEELTEEMILDGIEPRPPADGRMGERSWWMMQAMALVPLTYWVKHFRMRRYDLIYKVPMLEWGVELMSAWRAAAFRFSDQEFLEEYVVIRRLLIPETERMLAAMTVKTREAAVEQLLLFDDRTWLVPKHYPGPWSPRFSEHYVKAVVRAVNGERGFAGGNPWVALKEASAYLAPDVAIPGDDPLLRELAQRLAFRREMRETLLREDGRNHG